MDLDYKNLEDAIKKLNHSVSFQKESGQLMMTFKTKSLEFPVFIRILQENALLQIVLFLPCKPEETTLPDTLRLLNFFNREIDLPGFCFDERTQLIFYRIVIPTFDKKMVSESTLEKIFDTLPNIASTFAPLTQLVCSGTKNFKDIKNDFTKASPSPS